MNKILAYPGCYLVKVSKQHQTGINYGEEKNKRILKGEVVSIGDTVDSKYGGTLRPFKLITEGDILYFLSYEGGYDKVDDDLYSVLFDDARAYEKK